MDELLGKKTGQTPESVSNIARKTLMSPGFASTPEGQNLIKRIQSQIGVEKSPLVGKTFNLHDVENAFDNIRRVAARTDKQSAMGHMMEEKLSDFVYKLPGGADYMQRRSTYAVAKRLETAQRIKQAAIDAGHATFTGAGVGHAFANEMKKIARLGPGGKPNKLLRLWTPEQQEFIKRVAGRRDVGERMARFFGKMSPTHWGGGVMDSLLALVLGPWTAGGAMVAGVAGRGTERLIARSKMKEFDRLILKPAEDDLERVVGTPALNSVRGSPALESWKKRATRATTRALAIEIARQANKPQLIPRIEQEINQIEPASNQ